MKKMLLLITVAMLTLQVMAKENVKLRDCTVHYSRTYIYPNGDEVTIAFDHTAATCALAVKEARMAADVL